LRKIGVPYPAGYENGPAQKDLQEQAQRVVLGLKVGMVNTEANREIVALIAYLQRLGKDIKSAPVATPPVTATTTK
jgi:cytochrome c oxidase cbb3-type subunit I/II